MSVSKPAILREFPVAFLNNTGQALGLEI